MSADDQDVPLDEYETDDALNRRETVDDSGTRVPRDSTLFRVFTWFVIVSPILLAGVAIAIVLLAEVLDFTIPRPIHVAGIAFAVVAPTAGRWVGSKAKDWLWDPNWIYVVDLDARYQEGAIYRWPSQQFRELQVTEGKLDWLSPNLACAREVNLNEQTLKGTWRGTFSDRDLLRALSVVYECRESLEEDAKRGFAIEVQAFGIVRRATRNVVRRVVANFESWTLPDEGESLSTEIETAIEQYGLEDRIKQIREEEPDEEELNISLDDLEGFQNAPEASADD